MSMSLRDCQSLANSIEGNQNGFPKFPGTIGLAELIWALKYAVIHADNFRSLYMGLRMKNEGFVCIYKRAKPGEALNSTLCDYCDDCPVKDFCWKDKHFSK